MRCEVAGAVGLAIALTLLAEISGCSREVSDQGSGGTTSSASSVSHAASATHGASTQSASDTGAGGCTLTELPLIVDEDQGVPTRLHLPIGYQNAPAVLLVDTGSALTFLQEPLGSPDPVDHAGTFQIGCLSVDVIGRPEIADGPVNGMPSVGTLGTDMLLNGPSEIDFTQSKLLLNPSGVPFANAAGWPHAPFDLLSGAVVAHVALNGAPVRLILDTGSQDTLWIGQQPEPGDVEVDAQDAYGNIIQLYVGTVSLTLGTAQVTVPVLRAPSFPSFQPPAPDIVGLLGLSSLGTAFVIDSDTPAVRANLQ